MEAQCTPRLRHLPASRELGAARVAGTIFCKTWVGGHRELLGALSGWSESAACMHAGPDMLSAPMAGVPALCCGEGECLSLTASA